MDFPTASGLPATDITFTRGVEFSLEHWCPGVWRKQIGNCVDWWIVLIPCAPIHLCWHWHDPAQ
jgi:hypothetical protein